MNRTPHSIEPAARPVTLPNDFGAPIAITASLMTEDIHFSPSHGVLTVEKLYRTAEGKMGYGVISASGESRERRAYLLDEQGDTLLADNGNCLLELPVADLYEFLVMALQDEKASEVLDEHMLLKAVNEE